MGKIDNTDRVVSVNGQIGVVVLSANDVSAYTMDQIQNFLDAKANKADVDVSTSYLNSRINITDSSLYSLTNIVSLVESSIGTLNSSVNDLYAKDGSSIKGVINVGSGTGIFKDISGQQLELKTILPDKGIIITSNASDITISMDGSISTVTNLGGGQGIGSKSGDDIQLKSIAPNSSKIVITSDASHIYIDASVETITQLSKLTDVSIVTPVSTHSIIEYNASTGVWQNTTELFWDSSLATTTDDIGGIPPGTNLNNYTLKQILQKMLYEYQVPVIGLSTVPVGGILEKGVNSTINSSINLVWSIANTNYPIAKITSIDFTKTGSGTIGTINFSPNVDSSNGIFKDASGITNWGGTNRTITYTVRGYDNEGPIQPAVSASVDFTYYYKQYYGVVSGNQSFAGLNSSIIKGLSGNVIQGETDLTVTFVNPGSGFIKYLFAYPDTVSAPDNFGALSKIVDQNGFDITASFTTGNVDVSTDGGNVRYRAYLLTNKVTTPSFTVTFRF